MLSFLLYSVLPFLFILGFCITIHECGHFLFAKLFHIPVEKFSIGYGPPLIRKKIGETDFRISYFPLGGYVKMAGEEEGEIVTREEKPQEEKEKELPGFYDAPIYKRILVVFNGPLFNILSAFLVLFVSITIYGLTVNPYMKVEAEEGSYYGNAGFMTNDSIIAVNGQQVENWEDLWEIVEDEHEVTVTVQRDDAHAHIQVIFYADSVGLTPLIPPLVGSLKRRGPADQVGMKKGDRILKIDDEHIHSWHDMVALVRENRNIPLQFTWQHKDEMNVAYITPTSVYDPISQDTVGQIGIFIPHSKKFISLIDAFILSMKRTLQLLWRMLGIFYQLLTRQISTKQIGGPIAIFKLSTESAQWGFEHLLGLLVIISINLGLINLFPIPALDGGHILISTIEAIRRKRFTKKTRLVIQQIGYAIILFLIIFVTFNDLTRR